MVSLPTTPNCQIHLMKLVYARKWLLTIHVNYIMLGIIELLFISMDKSRTSIPLVIEEQKPESFPCDTAKTWIGENVHLYTHTHTFTQTHVPCILFKHTILVINIHCTAELQLKLQMLNVHTFR